MAIQAAGLVQQSKGAFVFMQAVTSSSVPSIGGVFRCFTPMRWSDTDSLHHINNTLYFRYAEEARVQLFEQVALAPKAGVVAHASFDFLKPLRYPGTVLTTLVLTRVGRSSLDFDVLVECQAEPGVVYAKGKNVLVGADAASGKSLPWTADELSRFAACFQLPA
jgi:acyl-CoA thioester hydrolase